MEFPKNKAFFLNFLLLAVIMGLLTALLPFVIRNSVVDSTRKKTELSKGKYETWGKFPGKLDTTIEHKFSFFDYSNISENSEEKVLPMDKSISFKESIEFTDFKENSSEISFNVKRKFVQQEQNNEEDKVTIPSLGFYEYLHTLSHPTLYQKAINSIKYFTEMNFLEQTAFLKAAFQVINKNTFLADEQRIKSTLLYSIKEEERKDFIYHHEKYGLSKMKLIYKWIKLINDDEAIKKATWLTEELGLTQDEIEHLFGKTSFLYRYYSSFEMKTLLDFNCTDQDCKLGYRQITDGDVLIKLGIQNIQQLYMEIFEEKVLSNSPEMDSFFNIDMHFNSTPFEEVKLEPGQLASFIEPKSSKSLNNPINMLNILRDNSTNNLSQEVTDLGINSLEQLNFVTEYFSVYLPKTYIYQEFEYKDRKYPVSGISKTFSGLLQKYITVNYGKMFELKDNLYSFLATKIKNKIFGDGEPEDVCANLIQPIVSDGRRVLKICTNEYYHVLLEDKSYNPTWINLYNCFTGKTCNETLKEEFKTKGGFSDLELKGLIDPDTMSFGYYYEYCQKSATEIYCEEGKDCSAEELMKIQFANSAITLNPPEILKDELKPVLTLNEWDPEIFPEKLEFLYKQIELGVEEEDCNEELRTALITLYNKDNVIFDDSNIEGFKFKNKLEIIATLLLMDVPSSRFSDEFGIDDITGFFNFIRELIKKNFATYYSSYKLQNIIQGNNEEDSEYLNLLKEGNYYDNYKPGITKTTGFIPSSTENVTSEEEENENNNSEGLTFYTQDDDNDNNVLRRILKMNEKPIYNVKKGDYSPTEDKFISVDAPLYQYAHLDAENNWISDGFQYPMTEEIEHIYYYDELSSRKFKFDYSKMSKYDGMNCRKYILNEDDLSQNLIEEDKNDDYIYAYVSQKYNKPFFITTENNPFSYDIKKSGEENFICVDEFSNMVLESNIHFVYAIDSKGYNLFNENVQEEELLPILSYNRYYKVSKSSYEDTFTAVTGYKKGRIAIIVVGILLVACLFNLAVYFYLKHIKKIGSDEDLPADSINKSDSLIPSDLKN